MGPSKAAGCEVGRLFTAWQVRKQANKTGSKILHLETSFHQVLKISAASCNPATCWTAVFITGACEGGRGGSSEFSILRHWIIDSPRTRAVTQPDQATNFHYCWSSLTTVLSCEFPQCLFLTLWRIVDEVSVVWEISKCKMRRNICQPFKELSRLSVVLRNPENRSIYIWHLLWLFIVGFTKYAQRASSWGAGEEMNALKGAFRWRSSCSWARLDWQRARSWIGYICQSKSQGSDVAQHVACVGPWVPSPGLKELCLYKK